MKKIAKYIIIGFSTLIAINILLGGFEDRSDIALMNDGKPIIFAHRGFVNNNVENSREAFLKSDSLGFSAIETDIYCTKDGKLILFHDESCMRLLGIDANINELNWDEIKDKNLIYNGKQTKNKVLSLDMFLEQCNTSKILYLDIKQGKKSIADSLLIILQNHKEHKNIIVADANLLFLAYMKYKNPNTVVALEGFNKGKEWIYYIIPKKFKPDYYSSFLSEVDEKHMEFMKEHDLSKNMISYGVDVSNMQRVFDLGVKNIILDYDKSMGTIDSLEDSLTEDN